MSHNRVKTKSVAEPNNLKFFTCMYVKFEFPYDIRPMKMPSNPAQINHNTPQRGFDIKTIFAKTPM